MPDQSHSAGWAQDPTGAHQLRYHDGIAFTQLVCDNGVVSVVRGWTKIHHVLLTPYGVPQRGMSVEATVTGFPQENVSIGAGCQSAHGISPGLVYQLVVYPDGQWYIEEARIGGSSVGTLVSGDIAPLGTTASLGLTCVITTTTSAAETTQLVGYVDGDKIGSIGDQLRQAHVGGYMPILVLGTFGPTASAAFTNITVRSLSLSP